MFPSSLLLIPVISTVFTLPAIHASEVTFFVTSDTHMGATIDGFSTMQRNQWMVLQMRGTPGIEYPEALGGGSVSRPIGVVVTGDLIDNGCDPLVCLDQWMQWISVYGYNGKQGLLEVPVYEGFGNHDGGNTTDTSLCHVVRTAIKQRNHERKHTLAGISPNGLHYSWDWGLLHLVQLNLYPGNEHEFAQEWQRGSWMYPEYSLDFLRQDLATNVGRTGRPIIIFHHYGFDEYWSKLWWTDHERQQYTDVLQQYNVIGIFVGHTHVCLMYCWEGFNVFNSPSSVQGDDQGFWPPAFLVVNVNFMHGTMRVAQRVGEGWGPQHLYKNFTLAPTHTQGCHQTEDDVRHVASAATDKLVEQEQEIMAHKHAAVDTLRLGRESTASAQADF